MFVQAPGDLAIVERVAVLARHNFRASADERTQFELMAVLSAASSTFMAKA